MSELCYGDVGSIISQVADVDVRDSSQDLGDEAEVVDPHTGAEAGLLVLLCRGPVLCGTDEVPRPH